MASINLITKMLPYVDEIFAKESKRALLTNQNFSWEGAKTITIYTVGTSAMNDYDRTGTGSNWSRYGAVTGLDATTQSMLMTKDRSFTFAIDKLDEDETQGALAGGIALARQLREVAIPEIDTYTYKIMCENAGFTPDGVNLTADNIYDEIIKAGQALDNAEVDDVGRILVVTPATYTLMKKNTEIIMETDISDEARKRGVIAQIDGNDIQKVPAPRMPEDFGFLLCHPCATVAPVKLEAYKVHTDPIGISGSLVEGRICYDAFVLDNKAVALYYQAKAEEVVEDDDVV